MSLRDLRRWLRLKLRLRRATIDFTAEGGTHWRVIVEKKRGRLLLWIDDHWSHYGTFTDIYGPTWEEEFSPRPYGDDYIPAIKAGSVKFLMLDGSMFALKPIGRIKTI